MLRALREARGVTQDGWAAQIGVGRKTVPGMQGDHDRALALLEESLALYRDSDSIWGVGRFLPVLAEAIFGQGQRETAARLCGAAAALRERTGIPLPPILQSNHDRMVANLRRTLGEPAFATAWAAGEAMSWEAAVASALACAAPA